MLDVIHYFFEDDLMPRWEQDSEIKSRVRSSLYLSMYNKDYKYALNHEGEAPRRAEWEMTSSPTGPNRDPIYDETPEGVVKPYFPPSSPDEMLDILGAPMGE